jgi:PII-like signaling protein
MNSVEVMVVRVYVTEGKNLLKTILGYLHDEVGVKGVTVFRGITGFGTSGKLHSSALLDLSLDLPIVIEFFDLADKVLTALGYLETLIAPEHIITWTASTFVKQ